jgi:outer membrane lipoprotein-sorting protein
MTKDGADFLKEMASAASSLKTYSFLSHMTVFKDGKEINENSRFYFKQPRQIRAEELGPYKKGSLAVLLKNGKVKGHLGGLLSKITGTVDSDSDWVRSANGYPLVDSDFFGMSQVMLNFVKEGKKSLVTEAPVTVPGQPQQVYVLELYSNAARTELMKRAYIDPQTLLPVEWFDYKNGKLFAHTNWKDVQINNDVSDSLFDI